MKPHWLAALLGPLFMLLEVSMDLMQPRLMASIVNEGVSTGNLLHIRNTGGIMLAVALVGLVGGVCCTIFSVKASQRFGADLRQELFGKVQTLSIRSLDRLGTGSLVTRLTGDIVQLQSLVLIALRMFPRQAFQFAGSLIMACIISPRLSLILLVMLPLLAVVVTVTTRMMIPLYGKVQEQLDRVNTKMQENLAGIRVVKAFVRSKHEQDSFESSNSQFLATSLKAAKTAALNSPLVSLILNFSVVAALWYGGVLSREGALSVGDLAAFLTYISQLLFAALGLSNQLMMLSRAKASASRVTEVLSEPSAESSLTKPAVPSALTATANRTTTRSGQLEFRDVTFSYDGNEKHAVLRDINFTAEPGQIIGIIGMNGSGKSTLVSLIPRFYEVTAGEIRLDGQNINELPAEELHQEVGMVLQQALLFSGTIMENLRYGKPEAAREEVEAAARHAQAHDFIMRLPAGYDTVLGQRGVNLSGGQKQRIAIARTLLTKPRILILDDCTSAVDLTTDLRIREALNTAMYDSTCLIIGQRIASIEHADHILVLEEGRITAQGTHQSLLQSSRLYREIALSQQGA
ncbi:multidrug ABC transporter ATP-binding protein [Paenibacillus donghaensis]|uniref:Multidrug ABC transporter ATP-binding protein n=2 Tax=Paenibacillus donghaensis TaxID=414771 RepID=A0A2Z2KZH0_9BACL|nr:ABC transporter ATP-binding protein [Paenibacillus donghaensis]ASA26288.1 multidrug ABC transporter ATP-binding protein [Paenibacillus donghaensis]